MTAIQSYAQAIKNTYDDKTKLDGYEFVVTNGNVGVYKKKGARLFAIRGMRASDKSDRSAVLSLISNGLKDSDRYKKDKAFIQKNKILGVKNIVVGHSLGGAIVDQLIDDGLFTRGLSFNPAIQPKDIKHTANRRLYNKDDFLYLLIGKYSGNHGVVDVDFKAFEGNWFQVLFKLWTAHMIEQFVKNETGDSDDELEEGMTGVRKKKGKSKKKKNSESESEDESESENERDDVDPPKRRSPGIVQSVIIEKSKIPDIDAARAWVRGHGYKVTKVDETPHTFRFRQIDPRIMMTGKYIDRMVKLGNVGYLNNLYED